MPKKKIIGLCGYIGSGKSTRASSYVGKGYEHICFADGVREASWKMLEWTPANSEEYETFKTTPLIVFYIFKDKEKGIIKRGGFFKIACFIFKNTPLGRHLLQKVGNDLREEISEDLWILKLDKKSKGLNKRVIPDVRYLNEVRYVIEKGGIIIFCDYRSDRYTISNHPSEALPSMLIEQGFKDGDDVTEYFKCLLKL